MKLLFSAVSLLFSAATPTSAIEPLHKTVVDFLTDRERSGDYFVILLDGHALLARSCMRAMQASGYLEAKTLVGPAELTDPVLRYALVHGHMHLAACMASTSAQQLDAVGDWANAFIAERTAADTATVLGPKSFTAPIGPHMNV